MILNVSNISEKRKIEVIPSAFSPLTYNGSNQSPTWLNYDPEQLTISGTTSATNAGTYQVAFAPTKKYKWADGSTGAKTVSWTITKAAGSLSLSASSGTIVSKNKTVSFTVTRAGNGAISASSSNTSIATVSVSGTTVTVTSKGYGSAIITVSVAEGANYIAPGNKTYSVTVDYQYLYNNGTEYTSFTGAFTAIARALEEGTGSKAPSITKGTSSITVKQNGNSSGTQGLGGVAYWANLIDLTNYDTLRVTGSFDGDTWEGIGVWSSMSGYVWDNMAARSYNAGAINISSLKGKYYIGFWVYYKGTSLSFSSVRLE